MEAKVLYIEEKKKEDAPVYERKVHVVGGDFFSQSEYEKVKKVDTLYSQLVMMAGFVSFDYFFMLKKFDSSLPERTFSYSPKFDTIRAASGRERGPRSRSRRHSRCA